MGPIALAIGEHLLEARKPEQTMRTSKSSEAIDGLSTASISTDIY